MRVVVVTVGALLVLSGCSVQVAGTPGPDPGRPVVAAPATGPAPAVATTTARSGPRSALDADPIADECLLDASEVGALVGTAVRPPRESTLTRPDGSVGRSCVATAGDDPLAMVNVYRTRAGTAAAYLEAGGPHRAITGVGDAAAVFDTDAGPTLQVASRNYLVTILVARGTPTDDAWRAAGTASLDSLPG